MCLSTCDIPLECGWRSCGSFQNCLRFAIPGEALGGHGETKNQMNENTPAEASASTSNKPNSLKNNSRRPPHRTDNGKINEEKPPEAAAPTRKR